MSSIVTFYSFKGGVGRTMALANIAVLLAQCGKRVLMIDWDLEAPGLHDYFLDRVNVSERPGLLHLLSYSGNGRPARWEDYVAEVRLPQRGRLDLLYSGVADPDYSRLLEGFDWNEFFRHGGGGALVESLRESWVEQYDYTFIDSRTGYTDAGGVCTMLLPDMLVAVCSANEQSLSGIEEAIAKAQAGRQNLDVDRPPLLVVPLPSRFDGRVEVEEARRWMSRFTLRLAKYYDAWLPPGTNHMRVIERTRVPHVPFYSFGEKLPVLEDSLTDPEGMGQVYALIARLFQEDFRDADVTLLGERADPTKRHASDDLSELADELDGKISARIRTGQLVALDARLLFPIGVASLGIVVEQSITRTSLTVVAATVAALSSLLFMFDVFTRTMFDRGIFDRSSDRAKLIAAREDLRVSRRLNRERPDLLRQAYEKAAAQLRSAEGKTASSDRDASRS
jgi:MinD-like ATPase involved in chromosome partitioning or flagellar assembly